LPRWYERGMRERMRSAPVCGIIPQVVPLSVGDTLDHYVIAGQLGAGGMGEVYRARDSRLKREVALKILPAEFAKDSSRRARFEQEAHAAAALNHPNIVALFDIGEHGDIAYIVTELVSGETLSSLIERGPINIRKLLDIAVQIADGMSAAHAAHITHRDLKPANIMVAADGRLKILDFGLARQASAAVGATAETMTQHTQPGTIVGTASYMSPEQARGGPIDFRSDQFSFGLILYEVVTGRRAFQKPESVQTLSAILTEEPPPIDRSIPAPLNWVIDRCLNKDPRDRYESTRDLYQELRDLRDHLSDASASQAVAVHRSPASTRWVALAVSVFAVLLAFAAGRYLATEDSEDQGAYRFTPFALDQGGQSGGAWSPDGKAVAYSGRAGGKEQVFVRYLDAPAPVRVTHTSDYARPFAWTPDGQRILFLSGQKPEGVWSIAAAGGDPEPLLEVRAPWEVGNTLTVSPDFKAIALLHRGDDGRYGVWVSAPPGSALKKYSPEPFATRDVYNWPVLRFSPDGKRLLLFLSNERSQEESWLLPYPEDGSRPPKRVLEGLSAFPRTPGFAWMPDSRRIVLATGALAEENQLWLADTVSGRFHALTSGTSPRYAPSVSPDGKKILFTENAGSLDIVSVNLKTAAAERLVATERNEQMPAWSSRRWVMAYVTDRNGPAEIWLHEGETDRPLVTAKDFAPGSASWFMGPAPSPDGSRVIYSRVDVKENVRLWISATSGGTPSRLTNVQNDTEYPGSWSPDGNWFVYAVQRGGSFELKKVKTTGQATPITIKAAPESQGIPSWSPDGNWICYAEQLISSDGQKTRPLPKMHSSTYMFSSDGKGLYGIRQDGERQLLFFIDLATEQERVVGDLGKEFPPGSSFAPGIRFSLAPDGKSFVYGALSQKSNLWLLEGFEPKTDLLSRLGLR
jgi:Tol biopolymer transport system component